MAKIFTRELQAPVNSSRNYTLAAMSAVDLSEDCAKVMDYYLGHMDGDMPAEPGRSLAVSMDVADFIEGLMPERMDIFAGSDEVVKLSPSPAIPINPCRTG
jgi:hypothetical protein